MLPFVLGSGLSSPSWLSGLSARTVFAHSRLLRTGTLPTPARGHPLWTDPSSTGLSVWTNSYSAEADILAAESIVTFGLYARRIPRRESSTSIGTRCRPFRWSRS